MSMPNKKTRILKPSEIGGVLTPQEMIRFVRRYSPFYKKLYSHLPDVVSLKDLPITPMEAFWSANKLPHGEVQTGPIQNGLILSSGGTTGAPKFTAYSKLEWQTIVTAFADANKKGYMQSGDRIANLFYVGRMYGSFIFTTMFLERIDLNLLQLPIAGHTEFSMCLKILKEFEANVIVGVPFSIMNLTEYLIKNPNEFNGKQIHKIFYAGEPIFGDQKKRIEEAFPQAKIFSIGYSCADAGLVGYFDSTCSLGEHRVYGEYVVVEIMDEQTGEIITETNREGIIVLTSLYRKLMPIVKYPVGDKAIWTEPAGRLDRKFKLMGRSGEAARIGSVKFYISDIRSLIDLYRTELQLVDFQIIQIHHDKKDGMILRVASHLSPEQLKKHTHKIIAEFERLQPLYVEMVNNSGIHAIKIEWISPEELMMNKETGKMRRVIEKRIERS